MYTEIFVPVDNSQHSDWAVDRAIELARTSGGRITANHVYAARLHDVRFRQLETGLPAQFQTPEEIKKQRKIHDKLIEKGLQLIADSFLDQVGARCEQAGIALTRQLLEGINYEEIVREVNRGEGRLPGLIGFDPNRAAGYDGSEKRRGDVQVDEAGRHDRRGGGRGGAARRDLRPSLRPRRDRGPRPRPPALLAGRRGRQPRAARDREGRAGGARRQAAARRPDHGLRRRLVLLLRRHAPGARAGARVRRDALRLQRVRRRVPPRRVPQHQGRALGAGLQGLQVRGAGGAAQQHHRQGPAEAVPGEPQAGRGDGAGVPGRRAEDADPDRQALPGDPAVGGGGAAFPARGRAPRRPPHRGHRRRLAGREPAAARALQPAARRDDRHPSRGHPLDRGGRQGGPAVGARRRGAHPARAALRAGHRAARGRGVRARAGGRSHHRHEQVAGRGDPQAAADAHAADHGHRLGRGDRTRRGEGRGAAAQHEGRGPRRRSRAGRRRGRDAVARSPGAWAGGRARRRTRSCGARRRGAGCGWCR